MSCLTHLPLDKMAAISQMTFSTTFSWMRSFVFWFQFHWRFFLSVQLTKSHHWFREWLGTEQATSHYLKHCWPSSLTHICGTRGRWVKWCCIPKSMHTLRILLFLVIFTHILQGCFTGTGAILWLPQFQWSNPGRAQARYWLNDTCLTHLRLRQNVTEVCS